jgi:hypothetical protein
MMTTGIASQAMFSVTSSVILAAFALAWANNLQITAAIPFVTQPLPSRPSSWLEQLRRRRQWHL